MYEIFEKLLSKKGITAYRVAKETGITTATLTSWKQGKYTPKSEKLQKIADYLGVSVSYLRGNSYVEDMGRLIQEDRISKGISQDEIAKAANISIDELDDYETLDDPIREDIFDDIVAALGTSYYELLYDYGLYDDVIPPHYNGDVVKWEKDKQAAEQEAMRERYADLARNDSERRLLMLCRRAGDVSEEEKEAIIDQFESTIDLYLRAKGVVKE